MRVVNNLRENYIIKLLDCMYEFSSMISFVVTNRNERRYTEKNIECFPNHYVGECRILNSNEVAFDEYIDLFEKEYPWVNTSTSHKWVSFLEGYEDPDVIVMNYQIEFSEDVYAAIKHAFSGLSDLERMSIFRYLKFLDGSNIVLETIDSIHAIVLHEKSVETYQCLNDSGVVTEDINEMAVKFADDLILDSHQISNFNLLLDRLQDYSTSIGFFITNYNERWYNEDNICMHPNKEIGLKILNNPNGLDLESYAEKLESKFPWIQNNLISKQQTFLYESIRSDVVVMKYQVKFTDDVLRKMKSYNTSFHEWVAPNYPEDLCFYNGDELIVETIIHEGQIFIARKYKYLLDLLSAEGIILQ